jgi:hypothetical protein
MISPGELAERLPDLIDEIREAGYSIGVEQYIAAQDLLLALAENGALSDDPARYRTLLGPIFCRSAPEQEDFHVRFDRWIAGGMLVPKGEASLWLRSELDEVERGARAWRRVLAVVSIAALALVAYLRFVPRPKPPGSIPAEKRDLQDKGAGKGTKEPEASQGGADHAGAPPAPTAANVNSGSRGSIGEQVANPAADVPETSPPPLAEKSVAGNSVRADPPPTSVPATEQNAVSQAKAGAAGKKVMAPPSGALKPQRRINGPIVLWTTLCVLVAGCFAWRIWWIYRARLFLRRAATSDLPDVAHLSVKGAGGEVFRNFELVRMAQRLRYRRAIASERIDVRATVLRTVRNAGWFTPVAGRSLVIPEYLVLIDRESFHDHQARFFDELVSRLEKDEVIISRYDFNGDPRVCRSAGRIADAETIRGLAARHPDHRLLIMSRGSGLIDPLTEEVAAWVDLFSRWNERY